jgi:hypothetical protein
MEKTIDEFKAIAWERLKTEGDLVSPLLGFEEGGTLVTNMVLLQQEVLTPDQIHHRLINTMKALIKDGKGHILLAFEGFFVEGPYIGQRTLAVYSLSPEVDRTWHSIIRADEVDPSWQEIEIKEGDFRRLWVTSEQHLWN